MTDQKLKLSVALLAFTQLWADGIWATDLSIPDTYTLTNPYTGPLTVTDSGVTSGNLDDAAIENDGTTTTIENSGYVSSNNSDFGIVNEGTINTLTNNGTITGNGEGIFNDGNGTINTLTNNGTITGYGNGDGYSYGYGIVNDGTINTLTNNGTITGYGNGNGYGILNNGNGTINTLTNNGTITGNGNYFGEGIANYSTINTLTNNGTITGNGNYFGEGIANYSTINTLTNNGTITGNGNYFGDGIANYSTINTLTNNGTITGNGNGYSYGYGILNDGNGTITYLNNAQGGNGATPATTALTYSGNLPTNYNIMIDSATHYGQLSTDGITNSSTTFGIYAGSNVTNRLYSAVLSGVAGSYPDNTSSYISSTTGTYDNMHWTLALEFNSDGVWDLAFTGVSLMQTQASLAQSAQALRGVYDLQNLSINNNLNNDCNLFDVHGICTSVTGTQNYLSGGVNNDTTSGTLTFAYRVNDHVRIGAYLDQNLNTSNVTGVHLNNGSPAFGAFAVWNANADGLGTQLRVSAGYADKDLTVTRSAVQTSEAGSGTTSLNSYGASAIASYAMAMPGDFIFSPYAGIRYTRVSADGYTEQANVNVTDPLTYSALTQNATTALVGTKWTRHIADNAVAYASIGLEQDLSNNGGTYSASSANIAGITPITFNPNINHTRPTASIGSYYNLGNTQRIAANLVWSEEAFTTANATSLMMTYTAGF